MVVKWMWWIAGEVDSLIVELMKVIVSIVVIKVDVITNVCRPQNIEMSSLFINT